MPCLHPTLFRIRRNPSGFDSNGIPYYVPSDHTDEPELRDIMIPCHTCYECRRHRANEWRTRLLNELESGGYNLVLFMTISFSPANYGLVDEGEMDRTLLRRLFRRFMDVFRKRYKYVPRYFFISEFGENEKDPKDNHRFHLHGFMMFKPGQLCPAYKELHRLIEDYFGYCWFERMEHCGAVNYSMKYAAKAYTGKGSPHPFCGLIIASCGIGKSFALKRLRSILGDARSLKRPFCIEYYVDGRPVKASIPSYYKTVCYRAAGAHPIPFFTDREPYLIRYGPFSVMSNAPDCEIADARDRYISLLETFTDYPSWERRQTFEKLKNRYLKRLKYEKYEY